MQTIWLVKFVALSVLLPIMWGCSNQWREAEAGISPRELMHLLSEVQSQQDDSLTASDVNEALRLKDESDTAIFFASAPGPIGSVASVLSLTNFEFIGQASLSWREIVGARVFFFDRPTEVGRENALLIGICNSGSESFQFYGFSGTSSINDGEFEAVMSSGGLQKLILRSFDIDGAALSGVIQLRVYGFDSNGHERYIGKFSTLVGFGG